MIPAVRRRPPAGAPARSIPVCPIPVGPAPVPAASAWLARVDLLLAVLLVAGLVLAAPDARAQAFDPMHTRIGFELYTRWGQRLEGRFPRYEGAVRTLPDGRRQVSMRLWTADVEIVGHPRYAEFARGHRFFDARRHPWVSFTSDPYPPSLLRAGGKLSGMLRIHGVAQHESFDVEPATCARPALDCDLVAHGSVRREDYGMDDWQWAVRPRVRFELRLRLLPETTP